jgi:hypothetical protein
MSISDAQVLTAMEVTKDLWYLFVFMHVALRFIFISISVAQVLSAMDATEDLLDLFVFMNVALRFNFVSISVAQAYRLPSMQQFSCKISSSS